MAREARQARRNGRASGTPGTGYRPSSYTSVSPLFRGAACPYWNHAEESSCRVLANESRRVNDGAWSSEKPVREVAETRGTRRRQVGRSAPWTDRAFAFAAFFDDHAGMSGVAVRVGRSLH